MNGAKLIQASCGLKSLRNSQTGTMAECAPPSTRPQLRRIPVTYKIAVTQTQVDDAKEFLKWFGAAQHESLGPAALSRPERPVGGQAHVRGRTSDFRSVKRDAFILTNNKEICYQVTVAFDSYDRINSNFRDSVAVILVMHATEVRDSFDLVKAMDKRLNRPGSRKKDFFVMFSEWDKQVQLEHNYPPISALTEYNLFWVMFFATLEKDHTVVRNEQRFCMPLDSGARMYFGASPAKNENPYAEAQAIMYMSELAEGVLERHVEEEVDELVKSMEHVIPLEITPLPEGPQSNVSTNELAKQQAMDIMNWFRSLAMGDNRPRKEKWALDYALTSLETLIDTLQRQNDYMETVKKRQEEAVKEHLKQLGVCPRTIRKMLNLKGSEPFPAKPPMQQEDPKPQMQDTSFKDVKEFVASVLRQGAAVFEHKILADILAKNEEKKSPNPKSCSGSPLKKKPASPKKAQESPTKWTDLDAKMKEQARRMEMLDIARPTSPQQRGATARGSPRERVVEEAEDMVRRDLIALINKQNEERDKLCLNREEPEGATSSPKKKKKKRKSRRNKKQSQESPGPEEQEAEGVESPRQAEASEDRQGAVKSPTKLDKLDAKSPTKLDKLDAKSPTKLEKLDPKSPTKLENLDSNSSNSDEEFYREAMELLKRKRDRLQDIISGIPRDFVDDFAGDFGALARDEIQAKLDARAKKRTGASSSPLKLPTWGEILKRFNEKNPKEVQDMSIEEMLDFLNSDEKKQEAEKKQTKDKESSK